MKITYYGHACFGIETQGKHLLVDPFITPNPQSAHIDITQIKVDYILLTHAHYDHVLDVEKIVALTNAPIISNHEIAHYYSSKGFQTFGMNHGGSWDYDFGKLKLVSAIHSSSFPDGTYGGNPCGFIIQNSEKTIYISGDTALTMDMKLIPMFFKLDLAIMPVGGYFTMDVEEAIIASDFVECNKVLGIHFDTADYIKIDHEAAKAKFRAKNKELTLLEIGASFEF